MTHAIRVHAPGGPEVMRWEEHDPGKPSVGEALVRHEAVGLNYIDVYHRGGLYDLPTPFTPGMEGAGVVEAVGPAVTEAAPGDRVAYAAGAPGSYAEFRVLPAERLLKLPESVSCEQGAAMMLKGMTAQYLVRSTYPLKRGDTILIHAAAGGVGLIVCQWARHLGATVIGTVGSLEKAEIARAHGCRHTIVYTHEDFAARVRELTDGRGVDVVYDSVGQATFAKSLDCLRPIGMLVCFGQASGPVPPFEVGVLGAKGSLFLTRPSLAHYAATREALAACAGELFEVVEKGIVHIDVKQTYPLAEAARAHRDLEGRRTTGASVLLP